MKKRILSIILSVVMIVGMIPLGTVTGLAATHTHTGTAITSVSQLQSLCADGGSGYLNGNIYLSSALTVAANKTVTLCLNGHIIMQTETNVRVFYVSAGSTLNLYDCDNTEHYGHINSTNHIWVADSTKGSKNLSVYGGYITGGNLLDAASDQEGGACVKVLGTFNMYSGNIVGCMITDRYTFTSYGGAVQVEPNAFFNMSGGTITGCTSAFGAVCTHNIYSKTTPITDGGTFTMSGGTIDSCYGGNGGAVNVYFGKFEMKKGTIQNCTATNAGGAVKNAGTLRITGGTIQNCTSPKGGAVFTKDQNSKTDANFTLIGGTIQNCTSSNQGGGVYTSYGTATITGGIIQNCSAVNGGGGVYVDVYTTNLTVGGNTKISGNFKGSDANNIHLATGKTIELPPIKLPSPIEVGVTMDTPGRFTEPSSDAEKAKGLFKSDSPNYRVKHNNVGTDNAADDYLELVPFYGITNGAPSTSENTNHGYLTIDSVTSFEGDTVSVIVTPSVGYQLKKDSLTVNGGEVPLTDKGNGKYEFTMPNKEVTVTAEFEVTSALKQHIINKTCDTNNGKGGRMARQGLIIGNIVSYVKGRTIIPLKQEQLDEIENSVIVVGTDGDKYIEITLDCAYTFFYDVDMETGEKVKVSAKDMGYAAFLIIDNDGFGGDITGFGYYRVYKDVFNESSFMLDALYADPTK